MKNIALFFKAGRPSHKRLSEVTNDLFATPVTVQAHTTKQGVFVPTHTATRNKKPVEAPKPAEDAAGDLPPTIKKRLDQMLAPLKNLARGLAEARSMGTRYAAEYALNNMKGVSDLGAGISRALNSIPNAANREAVARYLNANMPDLNLTDEERDYFAQRKEPPKNAGTAEKLGGGPKSAMMAMIEDAKGFKLTDIGYGFKAEKGNMVVIATKTEHGYQASHNGATSTTRLTPQQVIDWAQTKIDESERVSKLKPKRTNQHMDETIERIVAAARNPELKVVAHNETLGTDGKWRPLYSGTPFGVEFTGQTRTKGWSYETKDGTRVGTIHPTYEAAVAAQKTRLDSNDEEFRTALRGMSEDEIERQAAYWLKEKPAEQARFVAEKSKPEKSRHAAAAAMIRVELKKLGIPAKVRSEAYSGGTSVNVHVTDPSPDQLSEVKRIVNRHQYGTFDGMTDSYNYDNRDDSIPQVKYTFVEPEYSDALSQRAWDFLRAKFATFKDAPASEKEAQKFYKDGENGGEAIYRLLRGSGFLADRFWRQESEPKTESGQAAPKSGGGKAAPKTPAAAIKQATNKLFELSKGHHDTRPMEETFDALRNAGLTPLQEDDTPWSGFLTGEEGRASITLSFNGKKIRQALQIQWYKMPSGKWEWNAYIL